MTSAAESITESLRRTRQLMVQVCLLVCVCACAHMCTFIPQYLLACLSCFFCLFISLTIIQRSTYFVPLLCFFACIGGGKKCKHSHDFW